MKGMNSMTDPHNSNSEVELLKRQNRRLKVALSVVTSLLLIAVLGSTWQARRAAYAHEQAERARMEAVRALQTAEESHEQTEGQNNVEP